MIIAGLILIGISFFTSFSVLIYGLPILIIGVIILLNKNEDKIEQIKYKEKLKIPTHSNLKNSNDLSNERAFFKSKIKKTQRRFKK